jgi:hypothetical protein
MVMRLGSVAAAMVALFGVTAPPASAEIVGDMTAACGEWAFEPAFEMEEGARPVAYLPCGDDIGFIVVCILGDFIGGIRYYGPPSGEGLDYQEFRFTAGERTVDMYLRYEALDGAWATYTEFQHPLFTALREEAGPVRVTHLPSGESATLPLGGSARSFARLSEVCQAL